jgi:ATP/maltotriose-dependent transcriptional regulator MalT
MRQATEETMELAAASRYIIKRPRLTKLLDESSAKIKMLIAPAGYGKTTLAREWTSQLDVPIAWYECGHSAADLAAFSANVARAMQPVLPGVGESMIKALGSTYTAAENPEQLASLLAEDLEEWPEEAWLVVDDYHVAMGTELCEQFMDLLTRQRKLRILVCSRYRPGWATSRRILYGATLEMGQSLLAMTRDEATQTLEQRDASVVEGLLDAADGWPAVLGLAALAILRGIPTADIPDELHDYFAEELLDAATPTARDGLAMLAVADDVTTNLAKTVLGGDAHVVIREGCRVGFLASRAGTLYMHPLLRSFLRRRQTDLPPNQLERAIEDAVWHFLRTRSWDESFATIRRYNRPDLLVVLVEVAVDALLDTGRSSSLASWLNWGRNQHADAPPLDLAEAELSFRHGNYERAETLAIRAAKLAADNSLRTRALITAGRSASFRDRSGVALAHYADAEGSAVTAEQRRALLWGEVVETTYVDTDRGARLLAEYESLADGGITSQLRIAIGHLSLSAHAGGVAAAVRRARAMHSLLPAETDPLVRSSFLHS